MTKQEEFVAKATATHNGIYTYDKAVYINSNSELIITCHKHGDFKQNADRHRRGAGCPQCARERINSAKLISLETYKERCEAIHGNKFNYDKVKFLKLTDKVDIHCNTCGNDFHSNAANHMRGSGCPHCDKLNMLERMVNNKRLTADMFIERSRSVHGDNYDYSKVKFINTDTKVIIHCKRCNEDFEQRPSKHMIGQGHAKCTGTKTSDKFIDEAKAIHGDRYDYSKVDYRHTEQPVTIICKEHGKFQQTPHSHLKGHGCKMCATTITATKTRTPQEEYIARANEIHHNKFNYSKVKYESLTKPITIICPVHGEFIQRADSHLKHGCEQCHYDSKVMSRDDFIQLAKKVYGDTYTYDRSSYSRNNIPIIITCKIHGDFKKPPVDFLYKRAGCPICSASKGEKFVNEYLLKHNIPYIREYKIEGYNYRYDFYIPDMNLFIELDGEQHYVAIDHWGGEKYLMDNKQKDHIKNNLAALHKIRLIRIPYTKFNQLDTYLPHILMRHIKYVRDGIYFRNFLEFALHFNLPGDATPTQYANYLFKL